MALTAFSPQKNWFITLSNLLIIESLTGGENMLTKAGLAVAAVVIIIGICIVIAKNKHSA